MSTLTQCDGPFLLLPEMSLQYGNSSFDFVQANGDSRLFWSSQFLVTMGWVQGALGLTLGVQNSIEFATPFSRPIVDVGFTPKREHLAVTGPTSASYYLDVLTANGSIAPNSSQIEAGPPSDFLYASVVGSMIDLGSYGSVLGITVKVFAIKCFVLLPFLNVFFTHPQEENLACITGIFPFDFPVTSCVIADGLASSIVGPQTFMVNKTVFVNQVFAQKPDVFYPNIGSVSLVQFSVYDANGLGKPAMSEVGAWEVTTQK